MKLDENGLPSVHNMATNQNIGSPKNSPQKSKFENGH
jgi:hypothetical protein